MSLTNKNRFLYKPGNTLAFGVKKVSDGVQFTVSVSGEKECYLNLYKRGQKRCACRIALTKEYKRGCVYFVEIVDCPGTSADRSVADVLSQDYEYMYEIDGKEMVDPFAAVLHGRERWGKHTLSRDHIRGGIALEEFDWQGDAPLDTPFSDTILYQLHVRGFTKHSSSKVAHRGTFDAIREKIPYLKELGVNALLLLPCYEFDELWPSENREMQRFVSIPAEKAPKGAITKKAAGAKKKTEGQRGTAASGTAKPQGYTVHPKDGIKVNYWGYGSKDTYYFAPKAAYASDASGVCQEFKKMVLELHRAGIEILLDIYFIPGMNVCTIQECLRNWVLEYHIDGFRVNQEVAPSIVLVSDPVLSGVKLLADYWNQDMLSRAGKLGRNHVLAEYNEGFMNSARRFLKSDEGQVENFAGYFRRNGDAVTPINFISHVNGFTVMDLVSYDVKHNEANGEMNRDGTEYNYSWNCGAEGRSKKKAIVSRRMCQIRNAFAMMLLAQGTPMLLAGDEFGNTQNGNNNPYCQDNEVTWLDWRRLETYADIFDYVKRLIAFRKEHPVLHQARQLHMFDALSCGMPDISHHGMQAWRTDYSYYSRMLAVLLYGDYQNKADGTPDDSMYIIFNMYWEPRSFDLPNLPGDKDWYPAVETYGNTFSEVPVPVRKKRRKRKPSLESRKKTVVPPRSIVVFVGR